MNKVMLHVEGAFILILSIYLYAQQDYGWLMFFLLLLAPDISMLGYIVNKDVGAFMYNIFHTYSVPIVLVIIGLFLTIELVLAIGLIWFAHIGMDRMLGYGLKYTTDFKDTHLSRV